jgi:hypothetical protein
MIAAINAKGLVELYIEKDDMLTPQQTIKLSFNCPKELQIQPI